MKEYSRIEDYRDPALPEALRQFYATGAGQFLLPQIETQVAEFMPRLFGVRALQIGNIAPQLDFFQSSSIRYRACMELDGVAAKLRARPEAIPVMSGSADLVFLNHSLDFAVDPYQVLREVERVLVPDGHVLILGFNPLSWYGGWKLVRGWRGNMPWCGRFYLATRVADWLSLLGFQLLDRRYVGFTPPVRNQALRGRLAFMESWGPRYLRYFGGAYLLLAKKHVAAVTPLRPRWLPRRALFPAPS